MGDNTAQGQLVLAQNQYVNIQDATKGMVHVYAGPFAFALSNTDKPVVYDNRLDKFIDCSLHEAIQQSPMVPEGHYLVLENPAFDNTGALIAPKTGKGDGVALQVGRKINIPGPATFPLFPGQYAQVIPGHHLRSNQYLVVRVYNAEQANKNAPTYLKVDGELSNGQMIVIKGTEVPFFIPPTGLEVMLESNLYVREALTLERLEYCILLDEDGNKRYERGPQVVFPEATEKYMTTKDNEQGPAHRKFKAIELNDQMGLYIKVIADYEEDEVQYTTGQELFVTGAELRIYYPRPEHALIEYKDPKGGFNRQRYYGIAIPRGEGRYVLVKNAGDVVTKKGPQIFLPDPRNEVIVRRVLDDKTVALWYPGNSEAMAFNATLRSLTDGGDNYVTDDVVRSASLGTERSMNRMNKGSDALRGGASASFEGDKLQRGGIYTPPPTLTLATKYDGVPSVSPWVGYAVQVVDKSGNRRVVIGPATVLLEYDESLAVLELSTGKPKTTDALKRDVYLRVDNNLVSDIVQVETKDLANVDVKLSYRVNFDREHPEKWFTVENYVKYLCDHMRSILKGTVKALDVKYFIENSTAVVRDAVLGPKTEGLSRHRAFPENGMDVYDVEVLGCKIADENIATLLRATQLNSVKAAINLSAEEQALEYTQRSVNLQTKKAQLEHDLTVHKMELDADVKEKEAAAAMEDIRVACAEQAERLGAQVAEQEQRNAVAGAGLARRKAEEDYTISLEAQRTDFWVKKVTAISEDLIAAIKVGGMQAAATQLQAVLAPLALHEQQGLAATAERLFKGTVLEPLLDNLGGTALAKSARAGS